MVLALGERLSEWWLGEEAADKGLFDEGRDTLMDSVGVP